MQGDNDIAGKQSKREKHDRERKRQDHRHQTGY